MNVREAHPAEHDEIRALLTTAYGQYAGEMPAALFEHYVHDLVDIDVSAGRASTLVALADDRIVGTARYYPAGKVEEVPLPENWAWVRGVAVHPPARRDGVARALMAHCTRLASGAAAALSLHTFGFMPDAIRLYEHLGYQRAPDWDISVSDHYAVGGDLVALTYRLDLLSAS
ncbi:MAG: GNAT family N-acetyltransferase [Actinophytocola sp.]|uniref:GNAT family N-acetyltransferase n=1 Tax=Actinophytocola sp. TaxID=1872138 RepID=UPI001320BFB5|nr:GNAT family N-acetyltransferase [Actinophytocola sp.]MPZ83553.1 GNAT family N-acetyltransferase [Actinophytocola sp.]